MIQLLGANSLQKLPSIIFVSKLMQFHLLIILNSFNVSYRKSIKIACKQRVPFNHFILLNIVCTEK